MEWQETASGFSRGEMMVFLESFLDQHSDPGDYTLVEKMEIELPVLGSPEDLEYIFRKAFREKWEEIQGSRILRAGKHGENPGMIEERALSQLQFYLEQGRLHWGSRKEDFESGSYFFNLIMEMSPALAGEWLKSILAQPHAISRLVHFFDQSQLYAMTRLIMGEPSVLENAAAMIASIEQVLHRRQGSGLEIILPIYFRSSGSTVASLVRAWWVKSVFTGEKKQELVDRLRAGTLFQAMDTGPDHISAQEATGLLHSILYDEESLDRLAEEPVHPGATVLNSERKREACFVGNAGVVLFYPYLKNLFRNEGIMGEDHKFNSLTDHIKSCYLLQYLVSGETEIREYQLVLNKVLLGLPLDTPMTREWDERDADEEMAGQFMRKVIDSWPGVKGTSIEGFRKSFLLRDAKLEEEDHNWLLRVERKGWDVLLERLPYPLGVISLPWMIKPIYVQW